MGFWFFSRKRTDVEQKIEEIDTKIKHSFSNIKRDIHHAAKWVTHLETKRKEHHNKIDELFERIQNIEKSVEELQQKHEQAGVFRGLFKQQQTPGRLKQTAVYVQTVIPLGNVNSEMEKLTASERVIVWSLANTDLKLSYEDLAMLLGKDKATVRGQLNNLRRKNESLIGEYIEKNGKKRFYMDEKSKKLLLEFVTRSTSLSKKGKK